MPNNGINKKSGLTDRIFIDCFKLNVMFSVYSFLEKGHKKLS